MSPLAYEPEAAGALIGKTARWMVDHARRGQIPARKIGRSWVFTDDDLRQILNLAATGPSLPSPPTDAEPIGLQRSSMTPTTARRMR